MVLTRADLVQMDYDELKYHALYLTHKIGDIYELGPDNVTLDGRFLSLGELHEERREVERAMNNYRGEY